jgi:hypothetical protein
MGEQEIYGSDFPKMVMHTWPLSPCRSRSRSTSRILMARFRHAVLLIVRIDTEYIPSGLKY